MISPVRLRGRRDGRRTQRSLADVAHPDPNPLLHTPHVDRSLCRRSQETSSLLLYMKESGLGGLAVGFGTDCELVALACCRWAFASGSAFEPLGLSRRRSRSPSEEGQDLSDSSPEACK